MNKNIIKAYAKNINKDSIIKYASKESISISDGEINIILNEIHNNIDNLLDKDKCLEILNSHKNSISNSLYNKLLESYNKYKEFID